MSGQVFFVVVDLAAVVELAAVVDFVVAAEALAESLASSGLDASLTVAAGAALRLADVAG
jgi:hypothetical protein